MGLLIAVTITIASAGCGGRPAIPVKPTPTAAPASKGTLQGEQIIAEGRVTPVKSASLSFAALGTIAELPVEVGERVAAGQVLAKLDTRQLELQLAQADANLAVAQAKLDQLSHGPTDQDLAAAQQNVTSAQAAYDKLVGGPTASDVSADRAALTAAQQNYAKVRAGPTAEQLAALATQVSNAKAVLDQAQAAYDQVKGSPDVGMLPQSLQLEQATNNYNAAVAAYQDARTHPTAAELAAAASQVQEAQAALDRLTPDTAQVQAALTALENARAQLAKLQPTADDRAVLQASVNAAKVGRDLVAEQIKEASLVAPFAGTIMTLDAHAGEYATAGVPVLRLADTSAWQIETTDLTELNVVQVKEGTPVSMTFDAVPGLDLPGHVSQITPYGDSRQGDIVYTIIITPDQQDARLYWNMTAKVSIESVSK